ncbi:FAD:protein FMN transferase [Sedimentitalea sp. CY04]|uniref:FAD:protein FMN transferase n=1 Tax=Parasedimentitalea denitrificans TaxID=2211118 RepID=A0ABX0W9Q9_9RHOB|nr:FAD:protein FMN transferase [Sedimentitalea sp. CY04]NIZ62384.1 FAD:protein FMN transferase [Sedimentitalea sp. CY04]
MKNLNRRRFLTISAAACSLPMRAVAAAPPARWRGIALGAQATLQISGVTQTQANPIFMAVENELSRLEGIFSLYLEMSEIARLNSTGYLAAPSHELLEVLSISNMLNTASDGAFDPTVQSLWQASVTADNAGSATGWKYLQYNSKRVEFTHPDTAKMGLTLNGIAQGYITDKIAELLRHKGLTDVLVDFGEIVASGQRSTGQDWRIGIKAPDQQLIKKMTMANRALATSAPIVPVGNGAQPSPHIFSPNADLRLQHGLVSISAPTAAIADGLSTACCLLSEHQIQAALDQIPGTKVEVLQSL